MELEKLALCTREEFEQELNKMCPDSSIMNPGDSDAVFEVDQGTLIRPEIRKETTKQNHKRVMRSGSWIQATGPNNGHQLRDYSKSSNRSEIATPHSRRENLI